MYYELVIIGAGLTGLKTAIITHDLKINNVLIVDYEKRKGGFGSSLFEREEFQAEREILKESLNLPYEFWPQSTVIGFFAGENGENHQISIQTPTGTKEVEAKRVFFCTGSLEKPREAHQIAGSRPAGVMTPLMALGLIERNRLPGFKCLVVENGKISKAVANILEEKGCIVQRVPAEHYTIKNIKGNSRLNEVEIQDSETGDLHNYSCDTLIFSEGRIPCTFYLKGTNIKRDPNHFIMIDEYGRTNVSGVFAFGTCTNHAETFYYSLNQTNNLLKEILVGEKN